MEATLTAAGSFMVEKGGFLGIACVVLGIAYWKILRLHLQVLGEDRVAMIKALSDVAHALEGLTELIKAGRAK